MSNRIARLLVSRVLTGPSGAAFSPLDISGLVAWYDFSDVSTLYQDAARTTPVSSDGDPIGGVEDKSGQGRHLAQSITASKPTYKVGIQGGLSIARFDGGDILESSSWTLSQPHMTFIVLDGGGSGPRVVSGDISNRYRIGYAGAGWHVQFGTNLSGGISSSGWQIWTVFANGASSYLRKNAVSALSGDAGTTDGAGVDIGGSSQVGASWNGDVGEVFIYSAAVSDSDRGSAESGAADKWAISL